MSVTPLIIDTDVALGAWHEGRPRDIDDGFAIIEALNVPTIELLGVTTVFGNAPHIDVYRIAQELIEIKQASVPVVPGAMNNEATHNPNAETLPAVKFMAEALRKRRLSIAAIGPVTNIAQLVTRYPDVIENIDQLVMVAGRTPGKRFFIGATGPVADFNFDNDVAAMQLVLDANLPLVFAGFELTKQVVITESDLESIQAKRNPAADYFYRNSLDWVRHWTKTFAVDDGFHPWDSAAISYLTHPEYFIREQRTVKIGELDGSPTLDCSPIAAANQRSHTYLSGFTAGSKDRFVHDIVTTVY